VKIRLIKSEFIRLWWKAEFLLQGLQIRVFGVINLSMGSEELYEERQVLDDAAKASAEQIRMDISAEKDKSNDPHFQNIEPDKLSYDDLIVWDKYRKGVLNEKYFFDYYQKLLGGIGKTNEEIKADSRRNFAVLILNKTIAEEAKRKLEERERKKAA